MDFLIKFFGGAFALIALYLILRNYKGANEILSGFGKFNALTFSTLQGNTPNTPYINNLG